MMSFYLHQNLNNKACHTWENLNIKLPPLRHLIPSWGLSLQIQDSERLLSILKTAMKAYIEFTLPSQSQSHTTTLDVGLKDIDKKKSYHCCLMSYESGLRSGYVNFAFNFHCYVPNKHVYWSQR